MGKITDIKTDIAGVDFGCRSCAVVMHDDKILFQKTTHEKDKYWALPGGKIEVLETTRDTIARELKEELDIEDITVGELLSVAENFFEFDGKKCHQYIFVHKVTFNDPKYNDIEGIFKGVEEDANVIYTWIKIEDIKNSPIKPDYIVEQLLSDREGIRFFTCVE